ncbi:MAG TPA: tyrosine-type recombinase/integrase [Acidimicrobiales bacterium]|nr:tyrosine-type recombinase/integrase [Acidimicrobiales bacterium]
MASIDRRPNGKYRARWREYPHGPQHVRHFDRKADAQRFLDGIMGDLARGLYIDPASGRMPFRSYAEEWRRAQMHRPSTAAQCETYLRLHAYPAMGERPIGSIRRSEIQGWVKDRSEVLAPGSVELVYRWVSTIFKAAVGDRLIAVSPCTGIKLPKQDRGEIVPLAIEAVEAFADAVPERYRALILFAAGTGLRQGECFGLTVDRVDFLRRIVRVDRQLVTVKGGVPQFGPPKSQAGFRTVPMPVVVTETLAAHLKQFEPGAQKLAFTNSKGTPLRRSTFGDTWRRAVAAAPVPSGTTFHDLRHFYASLLIAHGCSVKAVQKRLGHQSALETLDTYSHLWPDSDDQTRDAIDIAFGTIVGSNAQAVPS